MQIKDIRYRMSLIKIIIRHGEQKAGIRYLEKGIRAKGKGLRTKPIFRLVYGEMLTEQAVPKVKPLGSAKSGN